MTPDLATVLADASEESALLRRRVWVYYLAHPAQPRTPRYVGMTSDLATRARSHAKLGGTGNSAITDWKRELRARGLAPLLVPIAAYPNETEARAAEWRLIHRWRRRGLCDLNSVDDGRQGRWDALCAARLARLGLV